MGGRANLLIVVVVVVVLDQLAAKKSTTKGDDEEDWDVTRNRYFLIVVSENEIENEHENENEHDRGGAKTGGASPTRSLTLPGGTYRERKSWQC
jgi:hypothetical protein